MSQVHVVPNCFFGVHWPRFPSQWISYCDNSLPSSSFLFQLFDFYGTVDGVDAPDGVIALRDDGVPHIVRVVAAATLSPSLRHLQLASADGAPLPPTGAGAHVLFNLPGAGRAHRNAYSLVNAPGSRSRYDIIVRRVAASRGGSVAVHERLQVGDALQAQWPANLFAPVRGARRHLMIAGGIGITPFLSYLQDGAVRQAGCELHVCCREEERGVFAPWLPADAPVSFHWDADGHRLDIAALNAPEEVVVSGESEALAELRAWAGTMPGAPVARSAFYDLARSCALVIQTIDHSPYCDFILVKGVVVPEWIWNAVARQAGKISSSIRP